jgi:hypothetical protein
MKASPLAQVVQKFGSKDKLVEAVKGLTDGELWIDRVDEGKGLERISNRKLLHLHDVLSEVKKSFGSRAKLIEAILKAEKRDKDDGLKARLEGMSTPRLLDHHGAAQRRAKRRAS